MLSFDLISTKMPFGGRQNPIEWSENHRGGGTQKTTSRCFFYLPQLFLAFFYTA